MPIYDYECVECGHHFDDNLRINDRGIPTETPCEKCGGRVNQVFTQLNIGDAVRLGIHKPSGAFNETLAKIHERTVGSKLNQKLSRNPSRKTTV